VLLTRALRQGFAVDADALFDAATTGDSARFRTLRRRAYIAMGRAAWPAFIAQMRAASGLPLEGLDLEPPDPKGDSNG
jgi:hypothetical protein